MANYKKLTDVEVMEEVSENSMALVNENGVLKQVPCGAGFSGGAPTSLSIICDSNGDYHANMTYAEFRAGFINGTIFDGTCITTDGNATYYYYRLCMIGDNGDHLSLSFADISTTALGVIWNEDNTLESGR